MVSQERGATARLFEAVKYFLDSMEEKPVTSIDNKAEIKFPKRGSSYFIGTAGAKAFGRGDTVDRAHLSEFAFYENPERILAGISEAAEFGQIDIETTANGRNYFYDLWRKATLGQSPYTPIFIPWYIDHEYSSDSLTEEERQGLSVTVQEMFQMTADEMKFSEEEKDFINRVWRETGIDITLGQIKWRRYKIWDKGPLFWQEYAEDPESCFLQSGRSVFKDLICKPEYKIPLDDINAWDGDKAALMKRPLFAGLDGAEGVLGGDRHCFSVIDVDMQTGVATVIFEYTSDEPRDIFWAKIAPILATYRISLGVEKNGVGVAHVDLAKKHRIPHTEWVTSGTTRPVMISDLEEAYRKGTLIETYREAENEARDMIYNSSNKPEAQKGKHDDRILSRAIALQMSKCPRPSIEGL